MHCGCPLPGKTISQKLSKLVTLHFKHPPPFLQLPLHAEAPPATHPSDHNGVYFLHDEKFSEPYRKLLTEKMDRRYDRASRSRQNDVSADGQGGDPSHHYAFLVSIPMFEPGACTAVSGNVLDSRGVQIAAGCKVGEECKAPIASEIATRSGHNMSGASVPWLGVLSSSELARSQATAQETTRTSYVDGYKHGHDGEYGNGSYGSYDGYSENYDVNYGGHGYGITETR
jgi:hypothetical protein